MDAQVSRGVEGGGRRLNHREFNYDRERRFPRLCFLITLIVAHCAVPGVAQLHPPISYLHLFLPFVPRHPSSRMLGEITTITYSARKKGRMHTGTENTRETLP